MGKFKPLLEIDGVPAVKRLIHSCKDAGVNDIVLVTGFSHCELEQSVADENVVTVYNGDYEQGMFTSIKAGLKKAGSLSDFRAFLLFLVDVPLVPSKIISDLINKASESPQDFAVPCYEGKKGHPLYIPGQYADEILNHDGTNGLKGVTVKYEDRLNRMETHNEAVVLDMDKPEEYEEIQSLSARLKSGKEYNNIFDETGFDGSIYLVRHGRTKQHKGKIFMGQVDVPLSDEGRDDASICAEEMLKLNPNTNIIYTSSLIRATETADIIQKKFVDSGKKMSIIKSDHFMETNLGDWDGKYIDDIKKEYPKEYERRGANLTTYKRYPDGENNFDLKYRVMKELKKIMSQTESGNDIILVSHKGVINAIRESIYNLDSVDAIKYDPPRGSITIINSNCL